MEKTVKRIKETVAEVEYVSIEELQKKHKTSEAILKGVCMMNGWAAGKQVTEKEYQSAVTAFLKSGVGGKIC